MTQQTVRYLRRWQGRGGPERGCSTPPSPQVLRWSRLHSCRGVSRGPVFAARIAGASVTKTAVPTKPAARSPSNQRLPAAPVNSYPMKRPAGSDTARERDPRRPRSPTWRTPPGSRPAGRPAPEAPRPSSRNPQRRCTPTDESGERPTWPLSPPALLSSPDTLRRGSTRCCRSRTSRSPLDEGART